MSMDRVHALMTLLYLESDWRDPNPQRAQVTAIQHALQTATRARRHAAEDHELIVAALLHDAARPLSDVHHGEVIAEILSDLVRQEIVTALYLHGEYQHAILRKLPWPDGPPEAAMLAAWDSASFDPTYRNNSMESFIPDLIRVAGGV